MIPSPFRPLRQCRSWRSVFFCNGRIDRRSGATASNPMARNHDAVARRATYAAGYTVRNRDQFRFVIEKVSVSPSGVQAAVLVCIADGSDLVKPGAGPGGADVIVDDAYTSGRASWDVRLDTDGVWRAYDAPAVGTTESSDVCPAG